MPGIKVVAACDIDKAKLDAWGAKYGIAELYVGHRRMGRSPCGISAGKVDSDIDLVLVGTGQAKNLFSENADHFVTHNHMIFASFLILRRKDVNYGK